MVRFSNKLGIQDLVFPYTEILKKWERRSYELFGITKLVLCVCVEEGGKVFWREWGFIR